MGINEFFRKRLGVPLRDPRKSWGAHDVKSNRVFLRVHEGHVFDYEDGSQWAVVDNPKWNSPFGRKERQDHIEVIRDGGEGFICVYWTHWVGDEEKMQGFESDTLLRVGDIELSEEDGLTYAQVLGPISVEEISQGTSQADDIVSTLSRKIPVTQKKALVDARIGQGKFREEVLGLWSHRCAATGVTVKAAIRASHIKPWRVSSDADRLNPHNGLPLVATLDSLFDSGLITFESSGDIMLSSVLKARDVKAMDLKTLRLRRTPPAATQHYLDYHRQHVFVG